MIGITRIAKPPVPIKSVAPAAAPVTTAAPVAAPVVASAPQATAAKTSDFLSKVNVKDVNSLFPNIDPKTGLPILNQTKLDAVLKKYVTDKLGPQLYRDNWNQFGWNAKSDASQVLHGAAIFGLQVNPGYMGNSTTYSGDFDKAAKQIGLDISKLKTNKEKYDAINAATKDLYQVSNTIGNNNHASILFKADGKGNLVPLVNQQTGAPAVNYYSATRNDMSGGGLFGDLAPFLAIGGLAFGVPAIMEAIGAAGVGAGTWEAANAAAGLGTAAGSLTPAAAASLGAAAFPGIEAGLGTGTMAGTMLGSTGAAVGNTANIAANLGSLAAGASNLAGMTADQIAAMNPADVADEIVSASDLGSQTFPQTVNASSIPGATAPAIAANSSTIADIVGTIKNAIGLGDSATISEALNNASKLGVLGSVTQAISSYLGASGQSEAAKQAAANQMAMFNKINEQYAPQRGAGYSALNQIRSMLPGQYTTYSETGQPTGTATGTDYLTRQFTPQDLYAGLAPNYQFQLQQGQMANQRAANVGGGALSGNTLAGLQRYTQDYAGNAYQQAFNNFQNQRTGIYNTLAGIAGLGQQAIGGSAQAGQAATTAAGQLGVGSAAANAAGMTGAANAVAGGLQNYQANQILQQILAQNQNVAQQNQG